jgi:hypothetical protein
MLPKEDLLLKVFRPIIIKIHQTLIQMIESEENTLKEIKTLLTSPYKPELKQKLEVELMLLQTIHQKMSKMLKLHKELNNAITEYLELKGWLMGSEKWIEK